METIFKRTHMCGTLRKENIGEHVCVNGWVAKQRRLGALVFCDIRDKSGIIQVVFKDNLAPELLEKANSLRSEYVVGIKGVVEERESKNDQIPTGFIEIVAEDLILYSEADTPPIYIKDDDNVSEDLRLKYRYLDLRKSKMQKNLTFRSNLNKVTRDYFIENGFTEVETPVLGKPTPEGARDYLVPSRVNHGRFYALPQSPQIFKQLLMIAGTDRYFQLARCFRDEDLRADRQPEFTQLDLEMSFVDQDDVITMVEGYLKTVFKKMLNVDIVTPIRRMTWTEAMNRYGSDKPDLRFGFELKDISEKVKNCQFQVFTGAIAEGGCVKGININGYSDKFGRKDIDKFTDSIKTFGAKGLVWIRVEKDEIKSSVNKFFSQDELKELAAEFDAKENDLILIVSGTKNVCWDSLGFLRRDIAGKLGLLKADDYKLLWVVDFPMFEWSDEEGRFLAMHHPFTSPKSEDIPLMKEGKLGEVMADAYDIVLNGIELGGGSIRIHNHDVQQLVFEALKLTPDDIQNRFGFFLEAFSYGAPPHGGLAIGLDRFVMLMAGADSIREIIAFPKNQNAQCAMSDAPTTVNANQLEECAIKLAEEE